MPSRNRRYAVGGSHRRHKHIVAECNSAHLAVKPLLVDESEIFRLLIAPEARGRLIALRNGRVQLRAMYACQTVSLRAQTPIGYLGHDDKLLARKLELPDGVTQDDLGETVRIHLCRIRVKQAPWIRRQGLCLGYPVGLNQLVG